MIRAKIIIVNNSVKYILELTYMQRLDKSLFTYTPLFCEENIWKLIESFENYKNINPVDVLFIINKSKSVALFHQQKSIGNNPVVWDYHVILSAKLHHKVYIFDFDSRCKFPTEINEYFNKTFFIEKHLPESYRPLIKHIAANDYLRHFSSNRKHMLNRIPENRFPGYDIIQPDNYNADMTLESCLNINNIKTTRNIMTPIEYLQHLFHEH